METNIGLAAPYDDFFVFSLPMRDGNEARWNMRERITSEFLVFL